MPQRQQPEREIAIETPVIQMQDLEHKPDSANRVNTKGVIVDPPAESLPDIELDTLEREDEKARDAVAEFEEQYRKLPPG